MVWGLVAALVAGIVYRFSFLWIFPPLFIASLLLPYRTRRRIHILLAAALLLFLHGQNEAESIRTEQRMVRENLSNVGQNATNAFCGWVASFPQVGRGRIQFRFRTRLDEKPVKFLIYAKTPGIAYGDSLCIIGKQVKRRARHPKEVNADDRFLCSRGVTSIFTIQSDGVSDMPGHEGSWFKRHLFWPIHDRFRREITRNLASKSGIPLALLLGEKGELDKTVRRTFVDLGISHLLALSGMHLGLVAGAILMILRSLRIKSHLLLLISLSIYVGIVGEVISLYRAYVMAVVLITARIVRRSMDPINALGNAVFLILLWSPHTFHSIGFQLSFLATFAVLLCIRGCSFRRGKNLFQKIGNYAISTIFVGIFVQVFIAPLLIHHFGRLSVVSPIATLVFFPFVFVVLFLSFICAISGIFWSDLGGLVALVLEQVVSAFQWLLLFSGDIAPPLVHPPKADVFLYCSGISLIWRSRRKRWRIYAGLILVAAAFLKPLINAS